MSRAFFSPWGRRLDEHEFADALAALGTSPDSSFHARAELSWSLPLERFEPEKLRDPRELVEEWRKRASQLVQTRPEEAPEVRLAVDGAWNLPGLGLGWLSRTLSSATAVGAVHFDIAPANPLDSWDWPLDVAAWEPADAAALSTAFRNTHWSRFVDVHEPGAAPGQIDILLVSGGVPEALARSISRGAPARVHTVLLDGGWQPAGYDDLNLLEALRSKLGAAAIVLCPAEAASALAFADELMLRLSHDNGLDAAVFAAARKAGWRAPFLAGRDGAFSSASISAQLKPRLAHLSRAAPPLVMKRRGPPPPTISAPERLAELAAKVGAALPSYRFDHEYNEATAVAELATAIDDTLRAAPECRFLQARLLEVENDVDRPVASFLRADADHRLDVRVGLPSAEWLTAPGAFPEPAVAAAVLLTVVFTEPSFSPEPQVGHLLLPTVGDSSHAVFHFRTGGPAKQLDGRVSVLHGNRVLQTVRIRAGVGGGDAASIEIESVVREAVGDVDWRPEFAAALVLNDNLTAGHAATLVAGDEASFFQIEDLKDLIAGLRKELERVSDDPDQFQKLRSPETQDLLGNLARKGRLLFDGLCETPHVAASFSGEGALQIVSLATEGILPLEYCYDRPGPDLEAKLCNGAEHALETGACDSACLASSSSICPLGFWGMRRVIERHAWDRAAAAALGASNYGVRSEATGNRRRLNVLGAILCGASSKARNGPEDTITPAFKAIADAAKTRTCAVKEVDAWDGWCAGTTSSPGLLLLVAHLEKKGGVTSLEIGDADFLPQSSIEAKHVGAGLPLLLLLGCRSSAQDEPFSSVVTRFRKAGAPGIVGSIANVRGRHMGPVLERLVRYLSEAASKGAPATLGALLPRARRELLLQGYPIALCLTAFGDADWRL